MEERFIKDVKELIEDNNHTIMKVIREEEEHFTHADG
jgi:hypothetical protein